MGWRWTPSAFAPWVHPEEICVSAFFEIGCWRFLGPSEFIQLVDEAKKRLEIEDPALLKSMSGRYTVIYSPKRIFSFPLWKYGGVSDSLAVWKAEGVLAA